MMIMNKKTQEKFSTVEMNLVLLNKTFKNNEDCSYHIRKALEHLETAYDITGGK